MGGPHTKVRRRSKVETLLPRELRDEVDRLLIEGATYEEVAAHCRARGYDISRSSIGRYGKEFLNTYRRVRIIEDQARALQSEPGEGLLLEEAASKLFLRQVLELLLRAEIDLLEMPRILSDFAKLQQSSVARERLKAQSAARLKEAGEKVAEAVEAEAARGRRVTPDELKRLILETYGVQA